MKGVCFEDLGLELCTKCLSCNMQAVWLFDVRGARLEKAWPCTRQPQSPCSRLGAEEVSAGRVALQLLAVLRRQGRDVDGGAEMFEFIHTPKRMLQLFGLGQNPTRATVG